MKKKAHITEYRAVESVAGSTSTTQYVNRLKLEVSIMMSIRRFGFDCAAG